MVTYLFHDSRIDGLLRFQINWLVRHFVTSMPWDTLGPAHMVEPVFGVC